MRIRVYGLVPGSPRGGGDDLEATGGEGEVHRFGEYRPLNQELDKDRVEGRSPERNVVEKIGSVLVAQVGCD